MYNYCDWKYTSMLGKELFITAVQTKLRSVVCMRQKTRNRQRWCFITEMFLKNFAIVFTLALLNGGYSGCMLFIHLVNNGTILFIDDVHRHVPGKTRLLKIKKIIELLIYFLCNRQRSALYWLQTCMLTRNFIIDLFDGRCDS